MTRNWNRQKGFTLIEMIVVLIIVSVLAAGTGMGIVIGVQGYMLSKDNAAITEKAQLAIARINRELLECYNCSGTTGDVSMPILNNLGSRYIIWNGSNIEISPTGSTNSYDKLLDNVQSFSMTYNPDKNVNVTFTVNRQGGGTIPFSMEVYPRNTPS